MRPVETLERIVVFGDITGIPADKIRQFMATIEAAGHLRYGGSYPSCLDSSELLTMAGITPDPASITPCRTVQERVEQILNNPSLAGSAILIVDRDPQAFIEAARSVRLTDPTSKHVTVINLTHPWQAHDLRDPITGIRVVTLPLYCYPTHPTPAS